MSNEQLVNLIKWKVAPGERQYPLRGQRYYQDCLAEVRWEGPFRSAPRYIKVAIEKNSAIDEFFQH